MWVTLVESKRWTCVAAVRAPRNAIMARRPCFISAVLSLNARSSSPLARPSGSK